MRIDPEIAAYIDAAIRRTVLDELALRTDAVLDVEAVAALLGVGRNTIYEACARGEIPHRRIGKQLRFSRLALIRWLDSRGQAAQNGR